MQANLGSKTSLGAPTFFTHFWLLESACTGLFPGDEIQVSSPQIARVSLKKGQPKAALRLSPANHSL